MSFKICHQLELNENSLFLGLIVVVSNRSGLGLMAPDLPAWDAGNLIAKLAMKIALLYWCATSWPCQMRLVGASFTTIWSTYTVVEILILFSLYSGKIFWAKNKETALKIPSSVRFGHYLHAMLQAMAQPEWAYEFPDQTGLDTHICRTGPAGPD